MKHSTKRRIIWCLFYIVTLAILIISIISIPEELIPDFDFVDKIEHFLAYFILGTLAFLAFAPFSGSKLRTVILVVLFCGVWGGMIEIIQYFIGRNSEVLDCIADLLGGTVGAFFVYSIKPLHKFI